MPSCCTPHFQVRSPKEFLTERKRHLEILTENRELLLDLEIEFLDFVIKHISEEALITEKSEKEMYRGIDWNWWIESGEENWKLFANIMSSFREPY